VGNAQVKVLVRVHNGIRHSWETMMVLVNSVKIIVSALPRVAFQMLSVAKVSE
jgi:hypothetical protein